jgi:hypothetical protein
MPDIFRANIAGKINQAMGKLLFDVTLTRKTKAERPENLTQGVHYTEKNYTGKGFVDDYKDSEIDGTNIKQGDRKVVILGASITVVPTVGDTVTVEGETRTITGPVKRDPAGATYECQSR